MTVWCRVSFIQHRLGAYPDSPLEPNGKSPRELTRDEEKGWILEDGKRIISFRAKTFQTLTDRLEMLVGPKIARVIFHQLGTAIGTTAMTYSRSEIHSPDHLSAVLDSVLKTRGWGRCLNLTSESRGTETVHIAKLKGTPLSYERISPEPLCHIVGGIISGWLETYLDRKAHQTTETECESTGKPQCTFEVVFHERPDGEKAQHATSTKPR